MHFNKSVGELKFIQNAILYFLPSVIFICLSLSFCRVWYCISCRGTVSRRRSCVTRCRWTAQPMTCGTVWERCCKRRATTPPRPNASLLPWSWRPAVPSYLSPSSPAPSEKLRKLPTNKPLSESHAWTTALKHTQMPNPETLLLSWNAFPTPSELFIGSQIRICRKTPIDTVISVNFATLLHSHCFFPSCSFLLSVLEFPPASVHRSGAAHPKTPPPPALPLVSFTVQVDQWETFSSCWLTQRFHQTTVLPETCPKTYNLEILVAVCHTNQ